MFTQMFSEELILLKKNVYLMCSDIHVISIALNVLIIVSAVSLRN